MFGGSYWGQFTASFKLRTALRSTFEWAKVGGTVPDFKIKQPGASRALAIINNEAPATPQVFTPAQRHEGIFRRKVESQLNLMVYDYEQYWLFKSYNEATDHMSDYRLENPGKIIRTHYMGDSMGGFHMPWVAFVPILEPESNFTM